MNTQRYLVTGGLGFIGNEVVRQLQALGQEVYIFDNRSRCAPRIEDISKVPVIEGSILDPKAVFSTLEKIKPSAVIHLAAMHYIPECNSHPSECMDINVTGTMRVAQAAIASGVDKFIFASSGAVYSDSSELLGENAAVEPIDIYGLSKYSAEIALRLLSASSKMKVLIARVFNNYGPRETNAHIIPEILTQLKKSRTLHLGNIDTIRDFILTEETARSLIDLSKVEYPNCETINIGSGVGYSMRELIKIIEEVQKSPIKIEIDKSRYRKADKETQVSDNSKLLKYINWKPSTSLQKGIKDLLTFEGM